MALRKAVLGSAELVKSGVDSNGETRRRAAGKDVLSGPSLEDK